MSHLPRYPHYKESGIEWLGDIPSHWAMKRLKYVIQNISDKVNAKESELTYLGLENIESFTGKLISSVELESEGIAHQFQRNDVLFGKLRPYLAKVYLADKIGLSSTEALVFRATTNISPHFLYYYCLSKDFINEVNGTTFGSKMPRASWEDISSFRICFPDLEEQQAISSYLDKKLTQIDSLITKQQALLEKLAEQRIALISNAVTKGINPDVEMKASGLEWLGETPSHWQVKKLKFLLADKLKYGANESAESEDKTQPRYIRITDIDEKGKLRDETFKSLECEKAQDYLLEDFDILFARSGATVGKSYLYYKKIVGCACYAGYLIRARLNIQKIDAEFIYYFLQSKNYWDWVNAVNIQATIQNISAEKYNDLVLSIPPLREQQTISNYLDLKLKKINDIESLHIAGINKLKEYRSALITQAVTGKIDVRDLTK